MAIYEIQSSGFQPVGGGEVSRGVANNSLSTLSNAQIFKTAYINIERVFVKFTLFPLKLLFIQRTKSPYRGKNIHVWQHCIMLLYCQHSRLDVTIVSEWLS